MSKKRPPYPPEFRRQMIELVRAGRSAEELAKEFEPSAQAIRNWVAQADRDAGRRSDGLTNAERIELSRLRRENKQLRLEREIPLKSRGLVRSGDEGGSVEGFQFVSAHRAVYPIAAMCRVLGVSSSGYYAWAKRAPSARAISDAALMERIGAIHAASHGTPEVSRDRTPSPESSRTPCLPGGASPPRGSGSARRTSHRVRAGCT